MTHTALLRVQLDHDLPRFVFFQTADEDLSEVQIGTDVDAHDRNHCQPSVFKIVPEYLHQRIADALANSGCSARLPHRATRITQIIGSATATWHPERPFDSVSLRSTSLRAGGEREGSPLHLRRGSFAIRAAQDHSAHGIKGVRRRRS